MSEDIKRLTRFVDDDNQRHIDTAMGNGVYDGLKKALEEHQPKDIVDILKASGLRGRGGAGFPTGLKWSFVPVKAEKPKYLCCNADEGEPGTFKDRLIMERDPHMLIEGIVIACYAIGIRDAYIYIRGEFVKPADILDEAIDEAYEKGFLGENILGKNFECHITVHRGAGAYVCGEETGLIESLEGKRGQPRLKPPFPAIVGAFQGPTVVNNVETLSNVPWIIVNGAEKYAEVGSERNPGTRIFGVSGMVEKPGLYELPMGTTLQELLDIAGGVKDGKKLKAIIPGGSSAPAMSPKELDTKMDFDSLMKAGSMAGSGGMIVLDETVCLVRVTRRLLEFYAHESCGQCTPCREGVPWMLRIVRNIELGKGKMSDIKQILKICDNIKMRTLCPLGDAAAMPTEGFVKKFKSEFTKHIQTGECTVGGPLGCDRRPRKIDHH